MIRSRTVVAHLALVLPLGLLCSCGDSSSPRPSTPPAATTPPPVVTPAPAPPPVAITGVVATGFPLAGATIVVTDSTGATVGQTQSASDGSFSVQPPATGVAPFVLVATQGSTNLVSVVADSKTPVVNITTLTNLLAALLSSTGSPTQLVADISAHPASAGVSQVAAAKNELNLLLAPLTQTIGVSGVDLVDTAFKANGTGLDQLLDSTLISIRPTGSGADVSLSIKQFLADGVAPTSINFNTTSPPTSVNYTVAASTLISTTLIAQAATFVTNLNACYGLAQSSRTNGTQITAPECTSLFYQGNPATYLNSGSVVGPSGSFSGLFSSSGNNTVWSNPVILYARSVAAPGGGTIVAPVVHYTYLRTNGTLGHSVLTLASTPSGAQVIGDQYKYGGSVFPEASNFVYLNSPAENYTLTGLTFNVPNTTANVGGTVSSIFAKVVVTTSDGSTYTLTPNSGTSFLVLPGANGQQGTSNVSCLEGAFTSQSTALADGLPSQYQMSYAWLNPPLSDAQIAQLPDQTAYQYQYFLAGNTTNTPDATQYYRTEVRPQTLAEFVTYSSLLPVITTPSIATLQASTMGTAPHTYVAPPATGAYNIAWTIPRGGQPATSVQLFGYLPGTGEFEDTVTVSAGTTNATIACSAQTVSDMHYSSGNYAASDYIQVFNFNYSDTNDNLYVQSYDVYSLF